MNALLTFSFLLILTTAAEGASRTPVRDTPQIAGREIPLLVLAQTIRVDRSDPALQWYSGLGEPISCDILPGFLVPVSQDPKGVYYQAKNGLQRLGRFSENVPGGVYVSKSKPGVMRVYQGDARNQDAGLILDRQRLTGQEAGKFKIGKPADKS